MWRGLKACATFSIPESGRGMQAAMLLPQLFAIFLVCRIRFNRAGSADQMTAATRQFDTFGASPRINRVLVFVIHIDRAVRAFQNAHAARNTIFGNAV